MAPWHYEAEGMPSLLPPSRRLHHPLHQIMTTPSRFLTPVVVSARYRVDTRVLLPLTRPHSIGSELETMNYIVETYWWPFAKRPWNWIFLEDWKKKCTIRESRQSPKMKNRRRIKPMNSFWIVLFRFMHRFFLFLHRTFLLDLSNIWSSFERKNFIRYCVDNWNHFPKKKEKKEEHEWTNPSCIPDLTLALSSKIERECSL